MAAHPKGRSGEPKSTLNQYYVEILQENKRLDMLAQMIHVLKQYEPFGLAVLCSGRDTLDDIISGLSRLDDVAVYFLHADLEEREKLAVLSKFQEGMKRAAQGTSRDPQPRSSEEAQPGPPRDYIREAIYGTSPPRGGTAVAEPAPEPPPPHPTAHVVVATDAAARGCELPPQVTLLCSYNLPPKKDVMVKRLGLLSRRSGAPRNVVHFCVTRQTPDFHTLQEFARPQRLEDLSVPLSELVQPLKP